MIGIDIDLGHIKSFRVGWDAKAKKALVSAFKGEAFRLKTIVSREIAGGVGPQPAPLTRAEEKTPTTRALSALGRFVAYEVTERSGDVRAEIGFSRSVTRSRSPSGRRQQLVALFGGSSHPITRADQARIARKVRKRLGEPVGKKRRSARRSRNLGRKWSDIRIMIPRVGTQISWPVRDWVSTIVARERINSAKNIHALFDTAVRGERWAKVWWTGVQGEVTPRTSK